MAEERMVQHGLIRKLRARLELVSAEADIPGKEIVWVPESLAARQAKILGAADRFQEELYTYVGASPTTG